MTKVCFNQNRASFSSQFASSEAVVISTTIDRLLPSPKGIKGSTMERCMVVIVGVAGARFMKAALILNRAQCCNR